MSGADPQWWAALAEKHGLVECRRGQASLSEGLKRVSHDLSNPLSVLAMDTYSCRKVVERLQVACADGDLAASKELLKQLDELVGHLQGASAEAEVLASTLREVARGWE